MGLAAPSSAIGAEVLPGPITATLTRVIDGDTVEVRARIWLGQFVEVAVRLAGVDAPELRARCAQERIQAEAAAAHLQPLEGSEIALTNVMSDKFGGRVRAEVHHREMGALGASLIDAGLARPYNGDQRRGWCSELAVRE
ncbi:MAG: nuclease [Rhodobiaceae bacterium]|nr:nuclease [Rhodobiaceae bacterium]